MIDGGVELTGESGEEEKDSRCAGRDKRIHKTVCSERAKA